LPEALRRAAESAGANDIVYIQPDGTDVRQSYAGLLDEARRILAGLQQAGVEPGDQAVLQLESNQDVLPVFWGCVLGGIVPVIAGVPPTYAETNRLLDQLRHVWQRLGQPAIITSGAVDGQANWIAEALVARPGKILTAEALRAHEPAESDHRCQPDDPLFFSMTSGSTSAPKCIPLTHRNILSRAVGTNELCRHGREDVILSWLPFDHIGSISDWHLRCVLLGCQLVYAPKEYVVGRPLRWLDLMDKYRVTHTWAPNFAYSLINDALRHGADAQWDLSCVEAFLSAGEAVSPNVVEQFLDLLARHGLKSATMRPAFGMAEMGSGVTYRCASEQSPLKIRRVRRSSLAGPLVAAAEEEPGAVSFPSLGPPIPGVALRIVDSEGNVVPEETIGHLEVKG